MSNINILKHYLISQKAKYPEWPILIALAILFLVSCSGNSSATNVTSTPQSPEKTIPISVTETILGQTPYPTQPSQKPTAITTLPITISSTTPVSTATPETISTRIPYQISDTVDYMIFGSLMWHPNNSRTTIELPIQVSAQPWSPNGSQIAGWDRKEKRLGILSLETGLLEHLENTSAWYSPPFWSPDGNHLLYSVPTEEDSNNYLITIYNLETKEEIVFTDALDLISLSGWSYDSSQVAYIYWSEASADSESQTILEIFDLTTQSTQQINSPSTGFEQARWSPTSKQLVIYSNDISPTDTPLTTYAYSELYLVDLETNMTTLLKGPSEQLPNGNRASDIFGYFMGDAPWSPDGNRIIYSDRGLICYVSINTLQEHCLTNLNETIVQQGSIAGYYPSWSSTNEWIGFILKFESLFCNPVAAASIDGSKFRFTNGEAGDCSLFGPIWSPKRK